MRRHDALGVITTIEMTRCNNASRTHHARETLSRRSRCGQALKPDSEVLLTMINALVAVGGK